jgi:hypothetical protein
VKVATWQIRSESSENLNWVVTYEDFPSSASWISFNHCRSEQQTYQPPSRTRESAEFESGAERQTYLLDGSLVDTSTLFELVSCPVSGDRDVKVCTL